MKKLLALILCVMMFISVIPTMAFAEEPEPAGEAEEAAGYPWIDNPLMALAQYKKEIENMVKNTKGNIQDAFAELAANRVVYSTAKGMDDTIVGLVDAITKDLIGKKIPVMKNDGSAVDDPEYLFLKADADNVKDLIRLVIDEKVTKSMADNEFKFVNEYNDDGSIKSIDPIKYAQAFGKAVSDARFLRQHCQPEVRRRLHREVPHAHRELHRHPRRGPGSCILVLGRCDRVPCRSRQRLDYQRRQVIITQKNLITDPDNQ